MNEKLKIFLKDREDKIGKLIIEFRTMPFIMPDYHLVFREIELNLLKSSIEIKRITDKFKDDE